jgi:hypothetical protein
MSCQCGLFGAGISISAPIIGNNGVVCKFGCQCLRREDMLMDRNQTCIPLLETAREAAKAAGIPENRIYILQLSSHSSAHGTTPCKTVDDLIVEGSMLRPIEPLKFSKGQGERQTAYLCYSSGTSGLPVRCIPFYCRPQHHTPTHALKLC